MNKLVDRQEVLHRMKCLRYDLIEHSIDVLAAVPTNEADSLIETTLDSLKRIEALLVRR